MLFLQKFQNRALVVRQNEKKFWDSLTPAFVTEESDDSEDPSVIVEHKLSWRSQGDYIIIIKALLYMLVIIQGTCFWLWLHLALVVNSFSCINKLLIRLDGQFKVHSHHHLFNLILVIKKLGILIEMQCTSV